MATASLDEVDELISCPVCFEHYRDPRSLQCAHQFCKPCLERLVVTKWPSCQREITCPTCRAITPLVPGDWVTDLPRPVLMNSVQQIMKILLKTTQQVRQYCDVCGDKNSMATKYCYDCHDNMCGRCFGRHQEDKTIGKHKSVPISDLLYCEAHSKLVTLYCTECQVGICYRCSRDIHKSHKKIEIEEVAKKSRDKIRLFVSQQKITADADEADVIEILKNQNQAQEITSHCDAAVKDIDQILGLLKSMADKLKHVRADVVMKTSADHKALLNHKHETNSAETSITSGDNRTPECSQSDGQDSLVDLCQYLVEKASDPEVVARAKELPSPTCLSTSPALVSIPLVTDNLMQLKTFLQSQLPKVIISYKKAALPRKATEDYGVKLAIKPKLQHTVTIEAWSLVFNPSVSQLTVRTDDVTAPIKVYDLKGNKLTQFGGGIEGLHGYGCLSLDSHRDLYLAACDGHLTTVTMDGQRKDRIDMEGCDLRGVTYIKENDLYVVSDKTNHKISLIDPKTKSVVRSFGSKGKDPGQFNSPYHICSYTDFGKPMIVVSDYRNNRIQLLDLAGAHQHTYGRPGRGDGHLDCPHGIAVDSNGAVIVGDRNNRRVVSYCIEDGQDQWQCLIPHDQLQEEPTNLDIDPIHNLLAVSVGDKVKIYSY